MPAHADGTIFTFLSLMYGLSFYTFCVASLAESIGDGQGRVERDVHALEPLGRPDHRPRRGQAPLEPRQPLFSSATNMAASSRALPRACTRPR